jgi:NADH:ubiquinone reductase (H+-translocating)
MANGTSGRNDRHPPRPSPRGGPVGPGRDRSARTVHRDQGVGAWRRAAAGTAVGLPVGWAVAALAQMQGVVDGPAVGPVVLHLAVTGAAIGLVVGHRPRGSAVAASGGVLVGLLGWLALPLTVHPVVRGEVPTWSVGSAAAAYPELVGGLLHGGVTGTVLHGLLAVLAARPRSGPVRTEPARPARVVIVGGGFAGVSAAQRFERLAVRGAPVDVTVISDSNSLLFTPMLAEVASSALEPAHISAPVRAAVAHTRFRYGAVHRVDTARRAVLVAPGEWVPYDHLVLAVGSVPHFPGLPGVERHARTLKDLDDATGLRDQVIGLLEDADHAALDPAERERLLTFVVAGGGFAGAEVVAELFDLVHGVLHLFPGVAPHEPRFVLVHSRDRILPELSPELGGYALDRLRARGIDVRLGVRVTGASAHDVALSDGGRIPTRTFVWTAGTRPGPLIGTLGGAHAPDGALVTDTHLRVVGLDGVWAVGDCARIPDRDSGGAPFPPTAQHAQRQGRAVADNIAAVVAGREPAEFRFTTIGVLVALGHRTAAAEIRGHRFSGLLAWLLWRGIYLAKLPGIEKRVRVLLDWLLDLVFPRDIVLRSRRSGGPPQPARGPEPVRGVPPEQASAGWSP